MKKINMYYFEELYWKQGCTFIAGVDEVGRGAWAGPVVVAACVLPVGYRNDAIKDSKELTSLQRETLARIIKRDAIDYAIAEIDADKVDILNPKGASIYGMQGVIKSLKNVDIALIDAEKPQLEIPKVSLIRGDSQSVSIAAASILAKVFRDDLMVKLDDLYPNYYFAQHKGYGTKLHLHSLKKYGPLAHCHRFSYKPIRNLKQIDLYEESNKKE